MLNRGKYDDFDFFSIKLVTCGSSYVEIPYDSSWRILPYTVLTSICETPGTVSGTSTCEFADGEMRKFAPGTTMLIPRNIKHRFTNLKYPHTAVWIHWDVVIKPNLDFFGFCDIPRNIQGENSRRIRECCSRIVESGTESFREVVQLKILLYSLLDIVLNECRPREEYYNFRSACRIYLPVLNYIDANLGSKLRLRDVAGFMNCSVSKMQRDFFRTFRQPIGDFIIRRRLNLASRLIAGSRSALAEIAEQTGFSDAFSLSKSFRKCYGLSPREYRNIVLKR